MPLKTPHKKQGYQRNQLLRYKAIMDEFNRHDYRYMPISVIWREFIYPKFFISRGTLYNSKYRCRYRATSLRLIVHITLL